MKKILDKNKRAITKDYLSAVAQYFRLKKPKKSKVRVETMTDTEFDLAIKQLNNEA
jgi:hypothetical protein